MNFNDKSLNDTYDINLFSVLTENTRTQDVFRPVPILNTIINNPFRQHNIEDTTIEASNRLEHMLLGQPMEQQLNTLFTHFFPEHVEYPSAADSLYDEPTYKHVISEEGKKELINIKYTKDLSTNTCPILQVQFNEGDEIIKLPCDHCFDPTAINTWLQNEKAECPVCRYKLKHMEKKIAQNA